MAKYTNQLAQETSPYLLQHAHNPVNWYPWGEAALQKARQENKPILVSIGYAACHWCHVMEKESFEDEDTAALMNEHFVNIKIDREERPDLDHIYMDAVQAMTGSGGWPLNVFLTPDGRPFYGGTYYPPQPIYNRPSWKDVLYGVATAFREKKEEIENQAASLTDYIHRSNSFGLNAARGNTAELFTTASIDTMFNNIMGTADREEGGFGNAPKFPQTFVIQFLLRYYHKSKNQHALDQACLSLDKMIQGGLYDHLGGGFARYSTDREWLVPHFEKMLYDNALLVTVLSEAWQLTQKPLYKQAVEETLAFVERELCSPEKGFYSALDADSEGVEGRYYVWSRAEVEEVLGEEATAFCDYYDITEPGNWEHTNILNIRGQAADTGLLQRCRKKLLERRHQRIRPLLDDKILLGWNALMNSAYSKAYSVFGQQHYLDMAVANINFLFSRLKSSGDAFYHTYKKEARYPAFLDDYAYLISALIHLQEVTGNPDYLNRARTITRYVIDQFSEEETGFFFFTNKDQQDVIVRKKEVYDGAVPSGNAIMAFNLHYLGTVFDIQNWKDRAVRATSALHQAIERHPGSFAVWAMLIQALTYGVPEIAIVGGLADDYRSEVLRSFIPFRVVQSSPSGNDEFPLLAGKTRTADTLIYLCKNYECQRPVSQVHDLLRLLGNV